MQHEKFQSAPGSRVGTPAYLAPEVIMTTKGQTYDGKVRTLCQHSQMLLQQPGMLLDSAELKTCGNSSSCCNPGLSSAGQSASDA